MLQITFWQIWDLGKNEKFLFITNWFSHFWNFDHGSRIQTKKNLYPKNSQVLSYILYGFSFLGDQLWPTFFLKNIVKICHFWISCIFSVISPKLRRLKMQEIFTYPRLWYPMDKKCVWSRYNKIRAHFSTQKKFQWHFLRLAYILEPIIWCISKFYWSQLLTYSIVSQSSTKTEKN